MRTARFPDYFFAPDVGPEGIDDLLELGGQVGREDTRLIEGGQSSIRAGLAGCGRLMAAGEPLISHFQQLIDAALAGAAAG